MIKIERQIEDFAEKMQNQPINIDLSVFIDSVV